MIQRSTRQEDELFSARPGRTARVNRLTADDTAATASDDVTVFVSDGAAVDLAVTLVDASALVVEPQSLVVTGTLAAQIVNAGPGVAAGPFDVTFFEDVNGNGVRWQWELNTTTLAQERRLDG